MIDKTDLSLQIDIDRVRKVTSELAEKKKTNKKKKRL